MTIPSDARKGSATNIRQQQKLTKLRPAEDEEATIKVASKAQPKSQAQLDGILKLKKPAPKHSKPGNWKDGSVIDGIPHPS
jgi:hypothetical protein